MPIKNFFKHVYNRKQKGFDIDKAMQKAVNSPDYNKNLNQVAHETLNLNIQELKAFPAIIEQLENCRNEYLLAGLMHNVVLLCRNKRQNLIPYLQTLLDSIESFIKKSDFEIRQREYSYCMKKLAEVKERDTHPHVMYYDLSNFLTSFYVLSSGFLLSDKQKETLEQLRLEMIAIMKQTKDEKEETIRRCRQVIKDTKSE